MLETSELLSIIAKLKHEKAELEEKTALLERDIEGLLKTKKILKARLQEKKIWTEKFTRQGYRYEDGDFGWHYMVFPVTEVPGDLEILEVKSLMDELFASFIIDEKGTYPGYRLESLSYSERKERWYVQIGKRIEG